MDDALLCRDAAAPERVLDLGRRRHLRTPEQEWTIVDAAFAWLSRHGREHPTLGALLDDGSLLRRARRITLLWHRATEVRINQLRRSEAVRSQMNLSHMHRTFTELARAFITKHETFSTFLSEPLDGMQRWQMFMLLITLVLEQLLTTKQQG